MGRKPNSDETNTAKKPATQPTETYPPISAAPVPKPETEKPPAAAFVKRDVGQPQIEQRERISFNLTKDGLIDWERLQGKTKTRLVDVLKADSEAMRLAGKTVEQESLFEFTAKDAEMALNTLNKVNSFATRFVFGRKGLVIDSDILDKAFSFQDEDKKELSERGARLANRYSTNWMREHADLVMFIGLYFACVTQQTKTAVELQVARNIQLQQQRETKARAVNGHAQTGPVPVSRENFDPTTDLPR